MLRAILPRAGDRPQPFSTWTHYINKHKYKLCAMVNKEQMQVGLLAQHCQTLAQSEFVQLNLIDSNKFFIKHKPTNGYHMAADVWATWHLTTHPKNLPHVKCSSVQMSATCLPCQHTCLVTICHVSPYGRAT
jgi:hypothetical protein